MTFQQVFLMLQSRYKIVLYVCVASVVIVMLVSLVMPKRYSASVSLVVDVKSDPISGTVLPDVASQNYIANQMEIIQSIRVASRAVQLLGPEHTQKGMEEWKKGEGNKTSVPFEYQYGRRLLSSLKVETPRGGNIIVLSVSGADPGFAAAAANAFAQAYIDTAIDLRVVPARQYAAWFEQRLKGLRGEMETAQKRLSDYQSEKGIVASDERYDQEVARLTSLYSKLTEIQGQKIEAGSRVGKAGGEWSSEVMKNTEVTRIRAELSTAEARLRVISTNAGVNNPARLQLQSQVDELKRQLAEEIRHVSASVAGDSRAATQQEADLQALIAAQNKRVLALRPDHDEIALMVKDVEAARQAYDAAAQRMSQLNLEGKSNQVNVSILSPAMPPGEASRPRLGMNFMASLGGGLLLGLLLAIYLESADKPVRGIASLPRGPGIPLLGVLGAPPRTMTPYVIEATMNKALVFKRSDSL